MPKPKDTLDRTNINSPCDANWDEMAGNDQVRFCSHCNLSVHNLSAMTRQDALRLVIGSKGKLCARYIRRPDGEFQTMTAAGPLLHSIGRRASRIAAGAFSAALSVSSSVVAASPPRSGSTTQHPAKAVPVAKRTYLSVGSAAGATINGVVRDAAGAVIPGALITLFDEDRSREYSTTTNNEGSFLLENISEGSFKLTIKASGFQTKKIAGISIGVNDEQVFSETLEVAYSDMGGAIGIMTASEPLVASVVDGDVNALKELLATGSDVNVLDSEYDSTALAEAVGRGNREMVQILISAGADVNMKNSSGHTALMSMTQVTTPEIIWTLLDAGAKGDLRDEDGMNALHYAASAGHAEALRALLASGVSVDARDDENKTALMIATEAGNTDNVFVLLKAGASVNLRDDEGTTALGMAIESDYAETAKVLMDFGGTE